jgi:hypothetical protein
MLGARTLRVLAATVMVAMMTITAGRAGAQVLEAGDPTPIPANTFTCNGLFVSPMSPMYAGSNPTCYPATQGPCGPSSLGWTNPLHESWILNSQNMAAASSPRDRRPAFFLQCWNGSWTINPYGLTEWWCNWRENPQTLQWEDAPSDLKSLNQTTLVWTQQPNGVPDQFEELYVRFETMWRKGIRRLILKLPGGVPYGKATHQYIKVNPDLTEVHLLINPSRTKTLNNVTVQEPDLNFDEFGETRDRGFVISVYNFYSNTGSNPLYYERLLNRWYSMGKILLPDFDGNGVVNQADYDRAYAAMHPTSPPSRYVVATGNVYPVGSSGQTVDQDDWNFWLAAWNSYQQGNHTGPTVEFEYGYAKTPNL